MNTKTTCMQSLDRFAKLVFVVFAFLFAVAPAVTHAAIFNDDVQDYPAFNVVNATRFPNAQDGAWATSETALPGDIVSFQVYYHNNGPQTSDIARNVRAWMQIPTGTANQFSATGGVRADNAQPSSASVRLTLNNGASASLQFIPGSVRWYPNQGVSFPQQLLQGQSGNELFTPQGLFLGDQNPGWFAQGNVVADFRVTQPTPPQPTCPTIATMAASNIGQTNATLNGTVSGVTQGASYWFEYGPSQNFGQSTVPQQAGNGSVSNFVQGLQPNTPYFARAATQASNCPIAYGQTVTFTTIGNPQPTCPTIATLPAANITLNSASLNATVSGLAGIGPGFNFEYGTTPGFGQSTVIQAPQNGQVSSFAGNLAPNTLYHFRAVLQAPNCAPAFGQTFTFTTGNIVPPQPTCPTITTFAATGVGTNTATLQAGVSGVVIGGTLRWFEYGINGNFGRATPQQAAQNGTVSDYVTDLTPNTVYSVRAVLQAPGCPVSFGQTITFTTIYIPPVQPPYVPPYIPPVPQPTCPQFTLSTLNPPLSVEDTSARVQGFINYNTGGPATTWFEYGETPALGRSTIEQPNSNGTFSDFIVNLRPGTTYYYRAIARPQQTGFFGYIGSYFGSSSSYCTQVQYGQTLTFTTRGGFRYQPPVIPVIPVLPAPVLLQSVTTQPAQGITQVSARLNGIATMNNQLSQGWFEWGPTVALGQQTAPADLGVFASNTFYAIASNVQPNTTYYFRAVLQNRQTGNTLRGSILSFRTLGQVYVDRTPTPTPIPTVAPARVTIAKEVANISFPNGTKDCVAGFVSNSIGYLITLKNTGSQTADEVTVRDPLSPYTQFVSATDGGTYDQSKKEVVWHLTLRAGEVKQLQIVSQIVRVTENIVADNAATVHANGVSKTSNMTHLIITIDPITLALVTDKRAVSPGETMVYTAIFRNESQAPINDAVLQVILPANTTFVGTDRGDFNPVDSSIVLKAGSMKAKEEGRIRFSVQVNKTARAGETLISEAILDYRDVIGFQQVNTHNFVPVRVGGAVATGPAGASSSAQGLGMLFGTGFLPQTLLGWLILLVVIVALIMVGRRAMRADVDRTSITTKI